MRELGSLDVRDFLASPRHAHHFAESATAQEKIRRRWIELRETGKVAGKTPIVNFQGVPEIVELHDGNASAVAWLLFVEERGISPTFAAFEQHFEGVIVLRDRTHPNGEVWHPFVPPEVACADRLQPVSDLEQEGREVRKALTPEGRAVYFNDVEYFSGADACLPLGDIARTFGRDSTPGG